MSSAPCLSPAHYTHALAALTATDPDLERVVAAYGPPPIWARQPGFPTLVHIILEQQVSLASARAAFNKLEAALPVVTPQGFLALDDVRLKEIGFSRQKTGYCRGLARAVVDGSLDFEVLSSMDDPEARAALMQIKGIGRWTADIYLLMVLLRPDIWPSGDLALVNAAAEVKRLPARPSSEELERMAEAWRPWRAVAARILWHHYLSRGK